MQLYETTFITSSQLDDSELDKEIKTVEDLIKSSGGKIIHTQRWGVRRFAYEIKRQKQGHYTHFLYESGPDVPAAISATFKVNEKIMRFLTVKSIVNLEELQAQSPDEPVAAVAVERPAPAPVVEPDLDIDETEEATKDERD
ncbi:MAG: 30S ribosomal protein S6 [bacterium]